METPGGVRRNTEYFLGSKMEGGTQRVCLVHRGSDPSVLSPRRRRVGSGRGGTYHPRQPTGPMSSITLPTVDSSVALGPTDTRPSLPKGLYEHGKVGPTSLSPPTSTGPVRVRSYPLVSRATLRALPDSHPPPLSWRVRRV